MQAGGTMEFEWIWKVKGLILDRCNFYVEKASREWDAVWTGRVDANNTVADMKLVKDVRTGRGAGR